MLDSLVYRNHGRGNFGMIRCMILLVFIVVSSLMNSDKLLAEASKVNASITVNPNTVYLTFDDGPSA
ncbi:hypothetical protein [Paenibacillus pini]|uniref:NodB homology domain-containing protein n=1 Tax=Paenibacillus pini JCM 16418 TaxID=1236976 RepID=W7Z5Q6_9BACL|nr:hypothetical protein [Paenibacillus pini]GAF09649.1 hypothetical protein JCM16418_3802 [Paenibacillus pini JCM 16418]